MRKSMLLRHVADIKNSVQGESYQKILSYFFPELVTAFILYSVISLIDARFIGELKSTSMYATLGITNNLLHFIFKAAEGVSIGASILCGQFNGHHDYKRVGKTLAQAFWASIILGLVISLLLYAGAYWVYYLHGVPERMITLGIPFLRVRSLSVFFTFVYLAFIAFLRGVKNTKTPMNVFLIGAIIFIFFDYALIFGKFGFPQLGLQGSACASLLQTVAMVIAAMIAVLTDKDYRKYAIDLMPRFNKSELLQLMQVSWPVVLDKSIMALAYIWLGAMIAPMGKYIIASFTVVKDMQRISFLPAVACAQIITFLASNDFGAGLFDNIKVNTKKVLFLSTIFVILPLVVFCIFPTEFISLFDQKGTFTEFSAKVFPLVSILLFFDILQLILSGMLRGIGQVKLVMWTRFFVCFLFFFPVSYFIAKTPFLDDMLKFVLIYGSFYIGNGLMSLVYLYKFKSDTWKQTALAGKNA